jgi:hypothetical protein
MSIFTLELFNSGEAFDEPATETARILRELADRIENTNAETGFKTLRDLNGNNCGRASFDWEG